MRKNVINSAIWTMFGYGAQLVLRFVGNLILTRLLFPEAFGLMSIVQSIMLGIELVSDVGINASVIRHERGDQREFLNTAWTLQVVRGVVIYLAIAALAYPTSLFYHDHALAALLPVAGLTAIFSGFNSTLVPLANRRLQLGKVTALEVGCYTLGLGITILLAKINGTVWALVWGGLIGSAVKAVVSHLIFKDERNRFAWDKQCLTELSHFGRWVMLASAVTFLAGEGNRLLAARFLGVENVAYFTIATTLNMVFLGLTFQIADKAFFPAYSRLHREEPDKLYSVLRKSRLFQIIPTWLVSLAMVCFGARLIGLLYDHRYAGAGFMLQLLALGSLVDGLSRSYNGILWAKGKASMSANLLIVQVCFQVIGMIIGYHVAGIPGVVASVAVSNWLMYPVHAWVYSRLKLWQPELDLPFVAASFVVLALVLTKVIPITP